MHLDCKNGFPTSDPTRQFATAAAIARSPGGLSFQPYGVSAAIREVYRMVGRVANTRATVFVTGESGCGKEVVARAIHERSERAAGPFVPVNCGAIPANLIEAELFGHEKGAFTGAHRQNRGCFERAASGTLFLDEVAEMAPDMQVRLLRVLESGRFMRVGGSAEISSNVRVIAATNREAVKAVQQGRLRADLMYRLAVFPLAVPALRDREGDAEILAHHFLDELNAGCTARKRFSPHALTTIRTYRWPGNVRELKNTVHRAFIMADETVDVDSAGLAGEALAADRLSVAIGTTLAEIERQAICATLDRCHGDKRHAAELLGISLRTLYTRLTLYEENDASGPVLGRRLE